MKKEYDAKKRREIMSEIACALKWDLNNFAIDTPGKGERIIGHHLKITSL